MERSQILTRKDQYDSTKAEIIDTAQKHIEDADQEEMTENFCLTEVESALEDCLLNVLNFISDAYDVDTDWIEISEQTILKLTYSKDGKTFKDRIKEYYFDYKNLHHDRDHFNNQIEKILETESNYIFNHEVEKEVKSLAVEAEIICHGDDECADYADRGRVPIDSLNDIPPFHPCCECYVIYYIQNSEDGSDTMVGEQ